MCDCDPCVHQAQREKRQGQPAQHASLPSPFLRPGVNQPRHAGEACDKYHPNGGNYVHGDNK